MECQWSVVSGIPLQPYRFFFHFIFDCPMSITHPYPPTHRLTLLCSLPCACCFLWTSTTFHTTQKQVSTPHGATHSPSPSSAYLSHSVSNTLVFLFVQYIDSQPSMQQQMNVPFFQKGYPIPARVCTLQYNLVRPMAHGVAWSFQVRVPLEGPRFVVCWRWRPDRSAFLFVLFSTLFFNSPILSRRNKRSTPVWERMGKRYTYKGDEIRSPKQREREKERPIRLLHHMYVPIENTIHHPHPHHIHVSHLFCYRCNVLQCTKIALMGQKRGCGSKINPFFSPFRSNGMNIGQTNIKGPHVAQWFSLLAFL